MMELMNMRSFVTVYLLGVVFGGRQASRTVVKMMGIKVVLADLHQDGEVRWRGLGRSNPTWEVPFQDGRSVFYLKEILLLKIYEILIPRGNICYILFFVATTMLKQLAFFLSLAASTSALHLTPENWDAETAGKTIFVKFYAPW
jgi:hypothetical protein